MIIDHHLKHFTGPKRTTLNLMTETDVQMETQNALCDGEWEDLNNFLLWCTEYSDIRNETIMLQRPYIQEEEKIIGQFSEKHIEENKKIVHEMWMKREQQLKISKN